MGHLAPPCNATFQFGTVQQRYTRRRHGLAVQGALPKAGKKKEKTGATKRNETKPVAGSTGGVETSAAASTRAHAKARGVCWRGAGAGALGACLLRPARDTCDVIPAEEKHLGPRHGTARQAGQWRHDGDVDACVDRGTAA